MVLAVSIPTYLSRSSAMAQEVRRIRLMDSFDSVRYLAGRTKPKNDNAALEKNIITWELDKLANYMRKYQKDLSSEEVAKVQKLIDEMGGLLGHLKDGKAFSKAIRLDTSVYVKSILNKRENNL
jgi:ribosome-binding ATPase YchF (GTP1/OBG family)